MSYYIRPKASSNEHVVKLCATYKVKNDDLLLPSMWMLLMCLTTGKHKSMELQSNIELQSRHNLPLLKFYNCMYILRIFLF